MPPIPEVPSLSVTISPENFQREERDRIFQEYQSNINTLRLEKENHLIELSHKEKEIQVETIENKN